VQFIFFPRGRTLAAAGALACAVLGLAPAASGAVPHASSAVQPVRPCASLTGTYRIPGAVTQVKTATPVAGSNGQRAYCDVRGFVEPAVGFDLKLPAVFNGRYLQYGCAGLCGVIFPGTPAFPAPPGPCGPPPGAEFAVAATDDGHTGQPADSPFQAITDGSWAAHNQAARDDYFYRGPHVVSVAAKRIIAAYYGSAPEYSYFSGCSTGGREGLLEAQRYPHDFNGIIAGSPGIFMQALLGVYFGWNARANMDARGAPILTADKLPALHNAVMAACDSLDGLSDGQIDDPRACRFDPGSIQCPPRTDRPTCLTPAQVAVVRKVYAGPNDGHGHRLYPGGEPRGTELAWVGYLVPSNGYTIAPLPDNYFRYVGYPIGSPASSLATFQFTVREFRRLTAVGAEGNALSVNLSAFRAAGGKLIIYHGWADQGISPFGTLDYYQRLWQHNGGLRATQRWARLFMIPGLYHCDTGGDTLTALNPFPALVDWVEHGHAPDHIIATGHDSAGKARTRPVFPYPLRAVYDGTGSINDARNFKPAPPLAPPHDIIHWAGDYLYALPGPVAP
jgi:feruloyl esterase